MPYSQKNMPLQINYCPDILKNFIIFKRFFPQEQIYQNKLYKLQAIKISFHTFHNNCKIMGSF